MRIPIKFPRLTETMDEGTVIRWHKSVGDTVVKGQLLMEVETDKMTQDVEALDSGTLVEIVVAEGTVKVGTEIGFLESE